MPRIKPFKGVYAKEEYHSNFAVSNIKVTTATLLKKKLKENPNTYLEILQPVLKKSRISKRKLYEEVRENYEEFKEKRILREDYPSIYVYEQLQEGILCKGIIALTRTEDYKKGIIKKHEDINQNRKKIFSKYLNDVELQAEPVLLTYDGNSKLDLLIDHETKGKPFMSFVRDGITHKLWSVENSLKISQFKDALNKNEELYIADGHHRFEASEKYAKDKKRVDSEPTGNEPYNFVMSYIVPSQSLTFSEYLRLIKNLNGFSKDEFLQKVSEVFHVNKKGKTPYYPTQKYHFSMYLDGEFYSLYVKKEDRGNPEGLGELDSYLLEKLLLKPILEVDKQKEDNLYYSKGYGNVKSSEKMKGKVDSGGFKVAFTFLPVSFEQLKRISDLGLIMPTKSTCIEPKLLTGMLIYDTK
ncbi:MAG: DUF1015 domain-containing protein [Flavobacteriales bacterium]|nr:DUF1015 domain-containing protein [Flavobacteriales bacterium]